MNLKDFNLAPLYAIDQEWALVTAGIKEKFNTMTVSWGGLGTLWNKPIVTLYIRPNRYTYEFTENSEYFTLSFYDEKYRKSLEIAGTKSGKNSDKLSLMNLTPLFLNKSITFEEAKLTIVCKKIYFQDLDIKNVPEYESTRFYNKEPIHRMYIGEVIDIIDKR